LKTREENGFLWILPVEGTVDNIDQKIDVKKFYLWRAGGKYGLEVRTA
jgi:hypothetical protein